LIELLVVVSIIAILLAILLPALQEARAQARQLLCSTNVRSVGQAEHQYKTNNTGWIPCGIMSNLDPSGANYDPDEYTEFGLWSTALLPYLNYDNYIVNPRSKQREAWFPAGPPGDGKNYLFRIAKGFAGGSVKPQINVAMRSIPFYQCPDHPAAECPLDFIANGMPIPLVDKNIGDLEAGDDSHGVPIGRGVWYYGARRETELAGAVNPADIIYITEAHKALWEKDEEFDHDPRFNTFFMAAHLPFAGAPRIANDQRHPGGLDCLFFDGHVQTLALDTLDIGWPNPVELRIRWVSTPYLLYENP